jgi:hypothetical protein
MNRRAFLLSTLAGFVIATAPPIVASKEILSAGVPAIDCAKLDAALRSLYDGMYIEDMLFSPTPTWQLSLLKTGKRNEDKSLYSHNEGY